MLKNILQIVACYVAGIVAGNMLIALFAGPLAVFYLIGAAIFGVPALIVTILIFVIFRNSIRRRTLPWCIAAPFAVALFWLTLESQTNYSNWEHDIFGYLSERVVWERAALAFICATISAGLFWCWNRKQNLAAG